MNGEIAAILAMDGIASGAIYVLIGLGLVLIFAVTRVIFVPFGDIADGGFVQDLAAGDRRIGGQHHAVAADRF